jgi:hypothetical protein
MAAHHGTSDSERCTWCGSAVEPGEGFRAAAHPGARSAVFCRLEHVVPWAIQGAKWEPDQADNGELTVGNCAHCGATLGDVHVTLVRHRGEHRIPDAFCSVDHLAAWAKDGGRWR